MTIRFCHPVALLHRDAKIVERARDVLRAGGGGDAETLQPVVCLYTATLQFRQKIHRMGGDADKIGHVGGFQPVHQRVPPRPVVKNELAATEQRCPKRAAAKVVTERAERARHCVWAE